MNNPRSFFFALTAGVLSAVGCNTNDATNPAGPSPAQATTYQYTAYDAGGMMVATGTLNLAFDHSAVGGQRDIKGTAPEAGTGSVSGQELADGSVRIDLNPGSPAVVVLEGKFTDSGITGTRFLDTGDPPANRGIGTFVIYRSVAGTR